MVNITNNTNHMTVTAGVFREIYAPQGWHLVNDVAQSPNSSQEKPNALINAGTDDDDNKETTASQDETTDTADDDETSNDNYEGDEEDESEDIEDEDLLEKPISEMSYGELVAYAKTLGINASGMRSKQEIRDAIKKANQ